MNEVQDRSIHDNIVYVFAVACEERRIVLHTEFRDGGAEEFTDVVLSGAVAHHLRDVLAGNTLFGIDEVDEGNKAFLVVAAKRALSGRGGVLEWLRD